MKLKYWILTAVAGLSLTTAVTNANNLQSVSASQLTTTRIKTVTPTKAKTKASKKHIKKTWSKRLKLRSTSSATKFKANIQKNAVMTKSVFRSKGRVYWHNRVFTYYSPNGSGATGMGSFTSDGTYTLRGYDSKGYLILANNKPFGTKIKTPLGWGVVHDRGTFGGHYDIVVK